MKNIYLIICALFFTFLLSVWNNGLSAIENFRFNMNIDDLKGEREAVKKEIKQYNINSASFYNTGGLRAGLDEIPAEPLLKRRLFKDINMLKRDGLLLVFDRDRDKINKVYFPRKDIAVAEAEEVWALALQKVKTREPVTTVKAIEIRVRYIFQKEPFLNQGLRWIVHDVDVYPINEVVPEFDVQAVL